MLFINLEKSKMRIKKFKDHIIFSTETIRQSIMKLGRLKNSSVLLLIKKNLKEL